MAKAFAGICSKAINSAKQIGLPDTPCNGVQARDQPLQWDAEQARDQPLRWDTGLGIGGWGFGIQAQIFYSNYQEYESRA